MYKGKERRKHRDWTEELMLNYALWGAVLRQAFEDAKQLPETREKLRNMGEIEFKSHKSLNDYKNLLLEELRCGKDACDFFKTRRLDDFITSNMLEIKPEYIRRKFKELNI